MNLFKSLLFLEGYVTDPRRFAGGFEATFGNKAANERAFRDEFRTREFGRGEAPATSHACAGGGR